MIEYAHVAATRPAQTSAVSRRRTSTRKAAAVSVPRGFRAVLGAAIVGWYLMRPLAAVSSKNGCTYPDQQIRLKVKQGKPVIGLPEEPRPDSPPRHPHPLLQQDH
ncbi:hypothetical protein BsWGS_27370 [Bradybaena similaris]